jgi:hypothetical protein
MTIDNIQSIWRTPSAEFSLAPFWFWNDELEEAEIARQLDEFQAHGIDAFVIHPRLGLPEHMGWMSDALLSKMRFAIEQAEQRKMWVILYDEGMYPSGSSAGQVVAENPDYQCRGMVRINLDTTQPNTIEQGVQIDAQGNIKLTDKQTLVAQVTYNGQQIAIVDRPIDSVIRGLHYIDETIIKPNGESAETLPPATDLLNPDAVACFVRLVYDRFYKEFGAYFGTVIKGIFTDEPMLLGRPREANLMPSTRGILTHINAYLGYDFTPHLPELWDVDESHTTFHDFEQAIEHHFETTYYAQLHDWCEAHHIALTGHPAHADATRHLRYFHIPGQDVVWRWVEPDQPTSLEGRESTQAKAASSMMLHTNRRRNANEFCGAFGHDFTFDEMQWIANWLLVRGCNLLIPHAFYYSIRGPRKHERPPMLGIHSPWWNESFTAFAQGCRRIGWLNTDSQHICHVAILGEHHNLPWDSAKVCYENQIDFNYLDIDDLSHCKVTDDALQIAKQRYQVLIVNDALLPKIQPYLETLPEHIHIIHWTQDPDALLDTLAASVPPSPFTPITASGLRVRHIQKAGMDWYILFNEANTPLTCSFDIADAYKLNPYTDDIHSFSGTVSLEAHGITVITTTKDDK